MRSSAAPTSLGCSPIPPRRCGWLRVPGYCARVGLLRHADHKSDDNPDDSRTPNNARNCPSRVVFCLVTRFAWSWQCGGQGFESP
jgi:hypothetical protein